jgi:hypothetical protein
VPKASNDWSSAALNVCPNSLVDNAVLDVVTMILGLHQSHSMTQNPQKPNLSEVLIKFYVPSELKHELQQLAASRNVSLSSLLRLVVTEYVKTRK